MPTISGPLKTVLSNASQVTGAWIRASEDRPEGGGVVLDEQDRVTVTGGTVSFTALPGPAVLILERAGGRPTNLKLVIGQQDSSLAEAYRAGLVAGSIDAHRLAQLVGMIEATQNNAANAHEQANRARDEADRAAGALSTKADKVHLHSSAEITDTTSNVGVAASADRVLRTNAEGKLFIPTGSITAQGDPVNKAYADAANMALGQRIDGKADSIHRHASDDISDAVSSIAYTPDRVVKTNAEGKLFIPTGSITSQGDPTNKAYVDSADTALGERIETQRWPRGSIPTSTTSLSDLVEGIWSVNSASRATAIGLPVAQLGQLTIKTLGGSYRTAIFSGSQTWFGITGSSGEWQTWQRLADVAYVDEKSGQGADALAQVQALATTVAAQKWQQGLAGTGLASLNDMADGVWRVQSSTVRNNLGLPDGFGILTLMSAGTYRTALYQTHVGDLWTNAATNGTWVGWKQAPFTLPEIETPDAWASTTSPWAGTSVDDAPQGIVTVWSGTAATGMGLPVGTMGVVQTVRFGNAATQNFYPVSTQGPQVWLRQNSGGIWTSWTQMGGGGSEGGTTVIQSSSAAARLKTVPLPLSLGRGNLQGEAAGSFRIPVNYTPRIMRWRLGFSNTNPRYGTTTGTGLTIDKITVGDHAGEGAFTASPDTVAENLTIPNDGSPAYTRWVGGDLGSGVDRLIGYTYTGQAGPPMLAGGGFNVGTASADEVAPATSTPVVDVPFDIWLEVEVAETVPVIAVIGDSITCGVGSSIPVHDAWGSVYMRQFGGLATLYGTSGDTGKSWVSDENRYKVSRFERPHLARPDAVVWAMGRNDFSGGTTATEMHTITGKAVDIITRRIGSPVFAVTVTPRRSGLGDAERAIYNQALMQSGVFRQVFDFATAITTPDGSLVPEFDADGLHFTTPGSTALAEAVTDPITAPPVMYATT